MTQSQLDSSLLSVALQGLESLRTLHLTPRRAIEIAAQIADGLAPRMPPGSRIAT